MDECCLVAAVSETMRQEPTLEAVRIDRAQGSVSVATLGRSNPVEIERNLTSSLEKIQSSTIEPHCDLVAGAENCTKCAVPGAPKEQNLLKVKTEAGVTTLARVTCPTAPRFYHWRNFPLPRLKARTISLPDDEEHEHEWKWQLFAAVLCGVLGIAGYLVQLDPWHHILYAGALIAGAWFTVHEVKERLEQGSVDVHFLMLAVAAGSVSIGAWGEGVMLLFLFALSGALEHYAMGRTHREIRSLFKTAPKTAVVLDPATGVERTVPVEELRPGMRIIVKPDEQFPVDGEVVKGRTASDEANLTGEATPVDKEVGDSVLAGTLNLWGAVEVSVVRPAGESALEKIIKLIQEAQHLKAPAQRFTDRFGTGYTYGILGLCFVMFFVWWLGAKLPPFISTPETRSAFYRAMTLLVVASPCALVLSIPSAILAAIAWAARRGILFRGGAAVEKLAEIDVVALDKTGTLTTGDLQVGTIESFPPGREKEIAQLAFSLEKLSNHPLARAVTRHGKHEGIAALEASLFESVSGLGLKARINAQLVVIGRREFVLHELATTDASAANAPAAEPGSSEVWVASGTLLGRLLLRDDIRPESKQVIAQLRHDGLRTIVLTGDHRNAAEHLQKQLGLDDVRAELKPEQKVAAIKELSDQGHKVAMVGDGVNDAPSLAAAHVGVGMGARGSDAALEQAEVVLMHDRLENFHLACVLSRRARAVIRQNLVISLGTVVVLVVCALFGKIPLTLGVLGHEGSTVIVVMNSLRLLFTRGGVKTPRPAK